jgi:phage repressor protein C with HTH and peptisase S24 domain
MKNWPIRRARITGDSMAPTYRDGEVIWVRLFDSIPDEIRLGTVVLVERDGQPGVLFIKRVQKSHGGSYWVEGDNQDLSDRMHDSRTWGYIQAHEIKGRAIRSKKIAVSD